MATAADPVLTRFRAALDKIYGERIERVVLFGSRARGDARPDSDYDVLVFLKDFELAGRHEEMARISKITADIVQDTGELISALPYPIEATRFWKWQKRNTALIGLNCAAKTRCLRSDVWRTRCAYCETYRPSQPTTSFCPQGSNRLEG